MIHRSDEAGAVAHSRQAVSKQEAERTSHNRQDLLNLIRRLVATWALVVPQGFASTG